MRRYVGEHQLWVVQDLGVMELEGRGGGQAEDASGQKEELKQSWTAGESGDDGWVGVFEG